MKKLLLHISLFLVAAFTCDAQSLDSSFADDGRLSFAVREGDYFQDQIFTLDSHIVVLNRAAKLISVGANTYHDGNVAITKLIPNGTIDSTFGVDGTLSTEFKNYQNSFPKKILQAPDSSFYILGSGYSYDSTTTTPTLLMHVFPSGIVDTAYGDSGTVRLDFFSGRDQPVSMVMDDTGKLIIAGSGNDPDDESLSQTSVIGRFFIDGTPDQSFGGTGKVKLVYEGGSASIPNAKTAHTSATSLQGLVIVPSGKIYVGGSYATDNYVKSFIAKFNTDGSLDTDFQDNGRLVYDVSPGYTNYIRKMKLLSNGTIACMLYTSQGVQDFTLGLLENDVFSTYTYNIGDYHNLLEDVCEDSNENLYLIGRSSKTENYKTTYYGDFFTVVKTDINGALDNAFGSNGGFLYSWNSDFQSACDQVILLGDTTLILSGRQYTEGTLNVRMAFVAVDVTSSLVASTKTENKNQNFIIYPNPTSEKIFVRTDAAVESIEVFNANGQAVAVSTTEVVDVTNLPNGHYVVKVTINKGVITKKVVKE